ncbi:ExbD/TolR family protein [Parapedobacter indicus]|uniref:Outer membrane transport energization protein ExbD n=1 Tax=Parapedobacter indicus TaxID=1477437 RepID=A0A1I3HHI2_9SPHI|nr:biopolymer transporter ExbD [Parapedobacter indicus]PPL03039.1 outer membrane transport energization protein ExbD [Parapedobacter indicus]SFI35132.1 outer membrane transport energization protein ExbD [Parapedobacter indicus]
MAELNTGGKQQPRVDLTAMVDLAFLLITFFMLTTSINKPNAMDVAMPDKNEEDPEDRLEVADTRTLTLLLGSNNKIEWYHGDYSNPIEGPEIVDYGKEGIRPILMKKMEQVKQQTGKDLIIVLRPSEKSTHRNLVDILDEMNIIKAPIYMIGTISDPEIEVLQRDNLYND